MLDLLPDGSMIRKLWIGEAELYRDHLLRLDAASRRSRFADAVADEFVRNYADLAFGIDTVIHGFFLDGTLRGAAELRWVGQPLAREAEAAFSIEQPWQSHGVGSALLERTLLAARNRGIKFLHMASRRQHACSSSPASSTPSSASISPCRRRGGDAAPDTASLMHELLPTTTALPPPCSTCSHGC
jgi:GNAT superfamily N-acetyltransferase